MLARTPSIVSWRPPRSPGQRRVSSTLTIPQPLTWSSWRTAYRLGSLRNIRTVFQRKYGIYLFRVKAKFSLNSANTGTGILPNTNFTFKRIFHEFQGIREIFRIGIGIVWVVELPRSSWKESALTRKSIFQCCEAAELFFVSSGVDSQNFWSFNRKRVIKGFKYCKNSAPAPFKKLGSGSATLFFFRTSQRADPPRSLSTISRPTPACRNSLTPFTPARSTWCS